MYRRRTSRWTSGRSYWLSSAVDILDSFRRCCKGKCIRGYWDQTRWIIDGDGVRGLQAHSYEFSVKDAGTTAVKVMIYSNHLMEHIEGKQDEQHALEGLEHSFPVKFIGGFSWSLVRYIPWDRKVAMVLFVNNATHSRRRTQTTIVMPFSTRVSLSKPDGANILKRCVASQITMWCC